jgi:hypothetical protein
VAGVTRFRWPGLWATALLVNVSPHSAWAEEPSDAYSEEQVESVDQQDTGDHANVDKKPLAVGGLEAPDAMPEKEDERSKVEKELEYADKQDAGRGMQFAWLGAAVGYQYAHLTAFKDEELLPDASRGSYSGIGLGGVLGVRVLYFSLGASFRYSPLPDLALWSLGAELAVRIPLGALEPFVFLGASYAQVSGAESASGIKVEGVHGFDARIGGGLDYYLSRTFSVGGQVAFDYLVLRRKAQSQLCSGTATCPYSTAGRGLGMSLAPSVTLALHF